MSCHFTFGLTFGLRSHPLNPTVSPFLHQPIHPVHGGNTLSLFPSLIRDLPMPINSSPPPFTTHSSSETVSPIFSFLFVMRPRSNPHPTGVYVTSIFVGAFAFGIGFDVAVSRFWDNWNRGVCAKLTSCISSFNDYLLHSIQKQWKDIRHKYVQEGDSE